VPKPCFHCKPNISWRYIVLPNFGDGSTDCTAKDGSYAYVRTMLLASATHSTAVERRNASVLEDNIRFTIHRRSVVP
jgi:hypothetical protein